MADKTMIEQFDDSPSIATYQQIATTTQIYPREHAVFYPALGLAGEAGEVANKIKKIMLVYFLGFSFEFVNKPTF